MGMPGEIALDSVATTVNGQVDDLGEGIGTEGVMSTFNEMTKVKTVVLKNIIEA